MAACSARAGAARRSVTSTIPLGPLGRFQSEAGKKELDRMYGIDQLDYGARWMDGAIVPRVRNCVRDTISPCRT